VGEWGSEDKKGGERERGKREKGREGRMQEERGKNCSPRRSLAVINSLIALNFLPLLACRKRQ
jgi:hypothetical protein